MLLYPFQTAIVDEDVYASLVVVEELRCALAVAEYVDSVEYQSFAVQFLAALGACV